VTAAILRVLRTIRPKYACRSWTDRVGPAKLLPHLIESGPVVAKSGRHMQFETPERLRSPAGNSHYRCSL
jgi:hypothetical protein